MKTIEDAMLMQKLVAHLNDVRTAQTFLKTHKNVHANSVELVARVDERTVPAEAKRDHRGGYFDGINYIFDKKVGWIAPLRVVSGPFEPHAYSNGRITTLGSRVMDGVRAAVDDEIKETEAAIVRLGFEVPEPPGGNRTKPATETPATRPTKPARPRLIS